MVDIYIFKCITHPYKAIFSHIYQHTLRFMMNTTLYLRILIKKSKDKHRLALYFNLSFWDKSCFVEVL